MPFAIYCLDKTGHAKVRAENRPAHLAYLDENLAHVVIAGPLLGDDAGTPVGSLLIMDFPDRAAADRFAAGDPYAKAGLFASVRVTPWRKVLPED
jgi:uncharacterized protein YciI